MIFIGDTHGLGAIFKIIDQNSYTDKNLVHVGDFGLGFNDIGRDVSNLFALDDALVDTNNHLYVIRGNHDNPIFWDRSKGLNLPKFHNLHLVDDYTVLRIEDKKILCVGGGISIDRMIRKDEKPYATWWKDEEFRFDYGTLHEAVKNHDKIDIVVTHTAPEFAYPTDDNVRIVNDWHSVELIHGRNLKADLKEERKKVKQLYSALATVHKTPDLWVYGHFHSSKEQIFGTTKFKLLNINETYEV